MAFKRSTVRSRPSPPNEKSELCAERHVVRISSYLRVPCRKAGWRAAGFAVAGAKKAPAIFLPKKKIFTVSLTQRCYNGAGVREAIE